MNQTLMNEYLISPVGRFVMIIGCIVLAIFLVGFITAAFGRPAEKKEEEDDTQGIQ